VALKVDLAGTESEDDTLFVMLDAANEKVLRIAELAEQGEEADIPALAESYCRIVSQSLLALGGGSGDAEDPGTTSSRAWRLACQTHVDVLSRTLETVGGEAHTSVRKAIALCENQ
jgi:hypothetical protein